MSSEVENAKEEGEEVLPPPRKTWKQRVKENYQLAFKFWELVLCIACLCFFFEPAKITGLGKSHLHHVGIAYTTFTGSILIICIMLLSKVIGDRLPYRTYVVHSITGSALFLITATLLIADKAHLTKHHFFHPSAYLLEMLITCTIFCFANAVVFAVDGILSFKLQKDF